MKKPPSGGFNGCQPLFQGFFQLFDLAFVLGDFRLAGGDLLFDLFLAGHGAAPCLVGAMGIRVPGVFPCVPGRPSPLAHWRPGEGAYRGTGLQDSPVSRECHPNGRKQRQQKSAPGGASGLKGRYQAFFR